MHELLPVLLDRIGEFGIETHADARPTGDGQTLDVDVTLSRGASRQRFAMRLRPHTTLSDLGYGAGDIGTGFPLLVGTASLSPRSADAFRRAGIQYIDAVGNAWLHFGDVLIDVRGRRPGGRPSPKVRRRGENLFSAARAQVTFALLQWPSSWKKPQRELAETAGVSLGQVNAALTTLRELGFGPSGHRDDAELLDLWAASFRGGLGRKLVLATYQGSIQDFRRINENDPVLAGGVDVSGELAAHDLLSPSTLTLYVAQLDPLLPVKSRWRSEGDTNITVRRRFWTAPPTETPGDVPPPAGLRTAPTVLVYADLMASDDPRARNVAREWRERIDRREQDR